MCRTLTHIAVVTLVACVSAFVAGSQAAGQGYERKARERAASPIWES